MRRGGFDNTQTVRDTNGFVLHAHGGGLRYENGLWYCTDQWSVESFEV